MSNDSAPKSAVELAMERLRKKDAESGISTRSITVEQRTAITEVRSLYDSKIAEQDILQQSAMRRLLTADPAELDVVASQFRHERERLASERDTQVEKLRRGAN